MNHKIIGMVALAAGALQAGTGIWIQSESGITPQTAAAYTATSNWADGYVPGVGDEAYFTNAFTEAIRYVKLPETLELASLYTAFGLSPTNTKGRTYFIGDKLTLQNGDKAGYLNFKEKDGDSKLVFADVNGPKGLSLVHSIVAGSVATPTLTFSGGTMGLYLDRYAKAAGEALVETNIAQIVDGSGDKYLTGPAALTADTSGVWKAVEGSPYLTRVSGPVGTTLAPGGLLEGASIAAGAFVKRIFEDNYIEMSEVATGTSAEAGETITFKAYVPEVTLHVKKHSISGKAPTWYLDKRSNATKFFYEIDEFAGGAADYSLKLRVSSTTRFPGTFVVHNMASYVGDVSATCAHILFSDNPNGTAGFPKAKHLSQGNSSESARLTVTNGIDAVVSCITNITGAVVKDGVGDLSTMIVGSNSGRFEIQEGTVTLAQTREASIGTLAISNGATLKLSEGTLQVEILEAQAGAILEGPGILSFTGAKPDLSQISLTGDIRIQVAGMQGDPLFAIPAASTPAGDPVLWMDASDNDTLTLSGEGVKEWRDVRSKTAPDAGYLTATNIYRLPKLINGTYGTYIDFAHINMANKPHYITNENVLVWSKIVENIKAIYAVLDGGDRGGYLLGHSTRPEICKAAASGGFFYRGNMAWYYPLIHTGYFEAADTLYIDGEQAILGESGFNGPGIQVVEYHSLGKRNIMADAFGTGYFDGGMEDAANGGVHAYEYIIYTNVLTYAERIQTEQYLLKKWKNRDVTLSATGVEADMNTLPESGAALYVAAGETVAFDEVSAGNIVKNGTGALYVKSATGGTLHVAAGTAYVNSEPLSVDDLPCMDDCWLHVDASYLPSLTTNVVNGTNFVTRWDDRRKNGNYLCKVVTDSKMPVTDGWLHENVSNGKPMVDLGEYVHADGAWAKPSPFRGLSIMWNGKEITGTQRNGANGPNIYSAFFAYDSSQGGGALLSSRGNSHPQYGFAPAFGVTGEPPTKMFAQEIYLDVLRSALHYAPNNDHEYYLDVRLNGVPFDPFKTNFSRGQDVFVYSLEDYPRKTGGFGIQGYENNVGGLMYGEVLLFTNYVSSTNMRKIERYLLNKWKGASGGVFVAAELDGLVVEAGSTVYVKGTAPLTVGTLKVAGGTLSGAVSLKAGSVLEVPVLANGNLGGVVVDGALDVSAGATVRITGNARFSTPGTYTILAGTGIHAADAAKFIFEKPTAPNRVYRLVVEEGSLKVIVAERGTVILVR